MDLELVDTGELMDELKRRFTHTVILGVKEIKGAHDHIDVAWHGNILKCCGLLQWANLKLMRRIEKCPSNLDDEGLEP